MSRFLIHRPRRIELSLLGGGSGSSLFAHRMASNEFHVAPTDAVWTSLQYSYIHISNCTLHVMVNDTEVARFDVTDYPTNADEDGSNALFDHLFISHQTLNVEVKRGDVISFKCDEHMDMTCYFSDATIEEQSPIHRSIVVDPDNPLYTVGNRAAMADYIDKIFD